MAIHLDDNLNDDMWAIFVRNWGDEGYCSSGQEEIQPGQPFTFSFRFRRPGASAVNIIPAADSDPAGQYGTIFYGDHGIPGTDWSGPFLLPNEGAIVTFTLPPPSERERINGMLHLKWEVSRDAASAGTPFASIGKLEKNAGPHEPEGTEEPEKLLGELIAKMNPAEQEIFFKNLGGLQRSQPTDHAPFKLPGQALVPRLKVIQGPAPQVKNVPDEEREKRDLQLLKALKSVYGDHIPLGPPEGKK